MLPIGVLKPLVEFIVNAVITTQVMLDGASGAKKKQHVWVNTANSIYNIADGFLNLPDGVDKWVKDEFIPYAIDKAVEYFKDDSNDSTFDKSNKKDVVAFIIDNAPKKAPDFGGTPSDLKQRKSKKRKKAYDTDLGGIA